MKYIVLIAFFPFSFRGLAQISDSVQGSPAKRGMPHAEILSGGFIDIAQTGQMNASARLFKLYIGEPGRWQVPVSVYSGVSANSFSMSRQNEDILLGFINPGTGVFNLSIDGNNRLAGKKQGLTTLRLQYQTGFRFLSVYNFLLYRNTSFYNLITGLGFTFVTGAWERDRQEEGMGLCWFNIRGLYSCNPAVINDFFEQPVARNMWGYSISLGIDISQVLNTRAFYYRFITNNEVPAFAKPVFQVSFNYALQQPG